MVGDSVALGSERYGIWGKPMSESKRQKIGWRFLLVGWKEVGRIPPPLLQCFRHGQECLAFKDLCLS